MTTFFQPSPSDPFSPGKVFTFLFLMLGPLKVIGPFAAMTAGWDGSLKRRLAFRAIAIAAVGLLAAVTLGAQRAPGRVRRSDHRRVDSTPATHRTGRKLIVIPVVPRPEPTEALEPAGTKVR